jgi:hypothetical protein
MAEYFENIGLQFVFEDLDKLSKNNKNDNTEKKTFQNTLISSSCGGLTNSKSNYSGTQLLKNKITKNSTSNNIHNLKDKEANYSLNFYLTSFQSQKLTKNLQNKLKKASKEEINNIFKCLKGSYSYIIKNLNGNYFCNDLFGHLNKSQRLQILNELKGTIIQNSFNNYGNHPIQVLIELSKSKEEYDILLSEFNLEHKIVESILDENATYVIQKILTYIPEQYRELINYVIIMNIRLFSTNPFGVCNIKAFLGHINNEKLINEVINQIIQNFMEISQNQYGNYLIQFILVNYWNYNLYSIIKNNIILNFYSLSCNQYSSHICRLFIKLCSNSEKLFLYNYLTKNNLLSFMGKNKFGDSIVKELMNSISNSNCNKYVINNINNRNVYNINIFYNKNQ